MALKIFDYIKDNKDNLRKSMKIEICLFNRGIFGLKLESPEDCIEVYDYKKELTNLINALKSYKEDYLVVEDGDIEITYDHFSTSNLQDVIRLNFSTPLFNGDKRLTYTIYLDDRMFDIYDKVRFFVLYSDEKVKNDIMLDDSTITLDEMDTYFTKNDARRKLFTYINQTLKNPNSLIKKFKAKRNEKFANDYQRYRRQIDKQIDIVNTFMFGEVK